MLKTCELCPEKAIGFPSFQDTKEKIPFDTRSLSARYF